jgi:hypothetical protein
LSRTRRAHYEIIAGEGGAIQRPVDVSRDSKDRMIVAYLNLLWEQRQAGRSIYYCEERENYYMRLDGKGGVIERLVHGSGEKRHIVLNEGLSEEERRCRLNHILDAIFSIEHKSQLNAALSQEIWSDVMYSLASRRYNCTSDIDASLDRIKRLFELHTYDTNDKDFDERFNRVLSYAPKCSNVVHRYGDIERTLSTKDHAWWVSLIEEAAPHDIAFQQRKLGLYLSYMSANLAVSPEQLADFTQKCPEFMRKMNADGALLDKIIQYFQPHGSSALENPSTREHFNKAIIYFVLKYPVTPDSFNQAIINELQGTGRYFTMSFQYILSSPELFRELVIKGYTLEHYNTLFTRAYILYNRSIANKIGECNVFVAKLWERNEIPSFAIFKERLDRAIREHAVSTGEDVEACVTAVAQAGSIRSTQAINAEPEAIIMTPLTKGGSFVSQLSETRAQSATMSLAP